LLRDMRVCDAWRALYTIADIGGAEHPVKMLTGPALTT